MKGGVRAFFIDGPDHGTTRTFETEPPMDWLTVGELSMQRHYRELSESTSPPDPHNISIHTHRYIRTYETRKGVWIFEYDGVHT
jgi:hypothetical protein